MPTVILSPHLDDAVLSAWSTLRGGGDVVVVNVFDGIPPEGTLGRWDRVTGAADSSERMRERLEEDRAALALAGGRARSAGLLEDQYRDGPPDLDELAQALRRAVGDAGEVWAPAGIGGHADHVVVRDWALALENGSRVHLYAELPYATRHGWPAWVTGDDPHPYFSHDAWWEKHLPARVALTPAAHRLEPSEAELKLTAIAAYRTQFYALDSGPIGTLGKVVGHEVSWEAGAG